MLVSYIEIRLKIHLSSTGRKGVMALPQKHYCCSYKGVSVRNDSMPKHATAGYLMVDG